MQRFDNLFSILDACVQKLDPSLEEHMKRVAYLSLEYARRNKFDDESTKDLVLSSYLHDIGIINTGRVTDLFLSEYNTVIQHCAFGYIYIRNYAEGLLPSVILYHHTSYDQIPDDVSDYEKYISNIVNIVDKVDVMLEHSRTVNFTEYVPKEIVKYLTIVDDNFSEEVYAEHRAILVDEVLDKYHDGSYIEILEDYINSITIDEKLYISLLDSLVYLIESHSVLTASHSHITAIMARRIATLVGLDSETQNNLYYAGILHDVGKIAVKDNILKKPGKLTNDEFAEMKRHVAHTDDILKGNVPDEIYYPAIRHHENLNGTGYPYGVKDLTLEEEVLRMSDMFAALSETRYYREALSIEEVKNILADDHSKNNSSDTIYNVIMNNIDELYNTVSDQQAVRMKQYLEIIAEYEQIFRTLEVTFEKSMQR